MGKRLCQRVSHGKVVDKFLHHLMFSSLQPVSKTLIDSFIGGLFFKKLLYNLLGFSIVRVYKLWRPVLFSHRAQ